LEPYGVIVAALGALGALTGGAWALRAILKGKLITIANHDEHVSQWREQVAGLRSRLTEQAQEHDADMERLNRLSDQRIAEVNAQANARISDRDDRIRQLGAEYERVWHALSLTDDAYKTVTTGRLAHDGGVIRTLTHILRESPLAAHIPIDPTPTVGSDDDGEQR
jgi:hypothetical protein